MKKVLTGFMLLVCSALHAQTLVDSALRYMMPAMTFSEAVQTKSAQMQTAHPGDTSEGGAINEFLRNARAREQIFCRNAPADSDALKPAAKTTLSVMLQPDEYCIGGGGNWNCAGPFNNCYGGHEDQGRANGLWVNPANDSIILAATFGGLWKSTNLGNSWHNISDGISIGYTGNKIPGTMAMTSIAVDPFNFNTIYVYLSDWGGTGYGAAYTTDGGSSWYLDTVFSNITGFAFFNGTPGLEIKYMPGTQTLFAYSHSSGGSTYVLKKNNPTTAWVDITPAWGADSIVTDMEFTIAAPNKVVFSTNAADDTGHLWTYNQSGGTWSNMNVTMPGAGDTITNIDNVSISATDSVFMLVDVKNKYQHLVCTPLSSLGMTVLNDSMFNVDTSAYQYLYVSPYNTQVMYTTVHDGLYSFYESDQRGANFTFSSIMGSTHADARFMTIYQAATGGGVNDDVLFGATDGGVVMKNAGDVNFHSITGDSLCITEFFGMSSMEGEDDLMIGGAQDNGRLSYNKNRAVPWEEDDSRGDNMLTKFVRNGVRKAFIEADFPSLEDVIFNATTESEFDISNPVDGCAPTVFWASCNNAYRPWYVDNSNNIYVGYSYVWEKTLTGATWHKAFDPQPTDPGYLNSTEKVGSVVIAEPYRDTVYIAYDGSGDPSLPMDSSVNERLWLSRNAFSTNPTFPPTWTSITPSEVRYWPIQSITTDPNNPGRIWVALSGLDWGNFKKSAEYRMHRMLYSPDYGTTWYDGSRGLPALGANKVLYRNGSKDELFCGTGLGLYCCDFSTFNAADTPYYNITWDCYNNGMPLCTITDMEINYCAGKLRAATFGRGIWETQMDTIPELPTVTIVPPGATWSNNRYLQASIDVQPGAVLTVTGDTLFMPRNGSIMVEPGGHLIVDSAKITNSCDNCLWQGIQARGNTTAAQSPATQGWVTIKRKSTLQNALMATSNYNATDPADSVGHTGGVIQSINSFYVNCQNAATFAAYTGSGPDLSYFYNNVFLLDDNYKGTNLLAYPGNITYPQISLKSVNGIQLLGNQFLNRTGGWDNWGEGTAISAMDAGFSVGPYNPGLPVGGFPARFCGFFTDINIMGSGTGAAATVSINNVTFDTSTLGINIDALNNVTITQCKFNIGTAQTDHMTTCSRNIGITVQNAQQFRIENNTFRGITTYGIGYTAGIIASNTAGGGNHVTIKLNYFDTLGTAILCTGSNRMTGLPINGGLRTLCNYFDHNHYDVYVTADGGTATQGIAMYQGTFTSSTAGTYKPAANVFSSSSSTSNITNIMGSSSPVYYYYNSGSSSTEDPAVITAAPSVYRYPASGPDSCHLSPGGGVSPVAAGASNTGALDMRDLRSYKRAFYINSVILKDSVNAYKHHIDFGNTGSLISTIAASTDTAKLYGTLSSGAPYISEAAFEAVADNGAEPYYSIMNLLKQNPDNLRDSVFLAYMQLSYGLNDADMDTLAAASYNTTALTWLLQVIDGEQSELDDDANLIIMALKSPMDSNVSVTDTTRAGICMDSTSMYYLLDSSSIYAGWDSLDTWYQNIGSMWTYYQRIGLYNAAGRYSDANTLFESMDALLPDASPDRDVYTTYSNLWGVVYNAETNGRDIYHLNSSDIASLDTSTTPVSTYNTAEREVTNVTSIIAGISGLYILCTGLSVDRTAHGGTDPAPQPIININAYDAPRTFSAYPNPASGVVTFTYNVQDGGSGITIVITNIVGEKVAVIQTENNAGSAYWNTGALPAGVYIYQAGDAQGSISKGKIVVER